MAVTKRNSFETWFGTAAGKAAFTSMALGDHYFETDTQLLFTYTGSAWVSAPEDVIVLSAGSAIIGKVGIDQTTPGTTNKVTTEGIAMSTYKTSALAASGVIKASAGTLYGFSGVNNSGSDQHIQIHDAAAVPVDTAVPIIVIIVPAGGNFSFDAGFHGVAFANGISWSNSSTLATKTIGSADCWVVASYK